MGQSMPRHVIVEGAVDQLERQGVPIASPDGPLTAGDLSSLLISGIAQGLIDPDKPVKLEDPNLTYPWEVRGVKHLGDELVLDVWGD